MMGIPRATVMGWLKKSDDAKPSARRVRHVQGRMNKTEAKYAERLNLLQLSSGIAWFKFESIKLRLADKTWYTPDFMLQTKDGVIEVHEVKGFWEQHSRAKFKIAAELFPHFMFKAVRWNRAGQSWDVEEV